MNTYAFTPRLLTLLPHPARAALLRRRIDRYRHRYHRPPFPNLHRQLDHPAPQAVAIRDPVPRRRPGRSRHTAAHAQLLLDDDEIDAHLPRRTGVGVRSSFRPRHPFSLIIAARSAPTVRHAASPAPRCESDRPGRGRSAGPGPRAQRPSPAGPGPARFDRGIGGMVTTQGTPRETSRLPVSTGRRSGRRPSVRVQAHGKGAFRFPAGR